MTVNGFRADKDLPALWQEERKSNRLLQLAVEALKSDHPDNHALNGDKNDDVSPTRAAIELGVTRGYSMCLGKLDLLGVAITPSEGMPESEYLPEQEAPKPTRQRKKK